MIGGVFAGSLAIISDAAHLLTDFASFMVSLLALLLVSRQPTKKLSFGWYRAGMFRYSINQLSLKYKKCSYLHDNFLSLFTKFVCSTLPVNINPLTLTYYIK